MPTAKKTSKTTKKISRDVDENTAENKPPNWPSFDPRPSVEDLSLREIYPGQIVTIPGFWTGTLCRKYVKFLSSLPLLTTPGKPKRGEAVRVNDRFQVDDGAFAERLWSDTGLREVVLSGKIGDEEVAPGDVADLQRRQKELWGGLPIGLNPNIRIYRYSMGQFFDQHYDDSNTLTHPGPPAQPSHTTWTLLLYLTSPATGCVGGETVFYPDPPQAGKKGKKDQNAPEPVVVELETGMALLHKHGKDCMLHEGREVTAGEKWVIRSDLCVSK